jgi:hypothetical protein
MALGELEQVLITEYARRYRLAQDRSVFGDVVGISLLSPCTSLCASKQASAGERQNLVAEPRPDYLLRGLRAPSGSAVFPALKAFAIRSRSATYLKGMHKHGPDLDVAETPPANACHADR